MLSLDILNSLSVRFQSIRRNETQNMYKMYKIIDKWNLIQIVVKSYNKMSYTYIHTSKNVTRSSDSEAVEMYTSCIKRGSRDYVFLIVKINRRSIIKSSPFKYHNEYIDDKWDTVNIMVVFNYRLLVPTNLASCRCVLIAQRRVNNELVNRANRRWTMIYYLQVFLNISNRYIFDKSFFSLLMSIRWTRDTYFNKQINTEGIFYAVARSKGKIIKHRYVIY